MNRKRGLNPGILSENRHRKALPGKASEDQHKDDRKQYRLTGRLKGSEGFQRSISHISDENQDRDPKAAAVKE